MEYRVVGRLINKDYFFAGIIIFGLYFLTRLPNPSYLELWSDGGPLVVVRTIKILVAFCVLLLSILGLGFGVATNQGSIFRETFLSSLVAVFGSGFSLLVIIGSFISLIPNVGKDLLAFLLYWFAIVGLTRVIQKVRTGPLKVIGKFVTARKVDSGVLGLISIFAVSVFVHGLVLETYSDVVQIYLPFFEYFESAGSSQAILEKPGFSSFLQLRGLGSHLSATSIGGWTSAQAGSLLALLLIAIVVFWGILNYSHRSFSEKTSNSRLILAGGAILAVFLFYSSAEIHSKPHLVSFSLLIVLSASLPIAFNSSTSEGLRFKRTSILAAIAVCIVYPLNYFAVVLIVFVNALIFRVFQKMLPTVQIVKTLAWASFSTAVVFITNLCFVGVFGTEPMIRRVKVGHIFEKYSSEKIWIDLYSAQGISNFQSVFREPFASQGLLSVDSFFKLVGFLTTSSFLFLFAGAFFIVISFWFRPKALILFIFGAFIIFVVLERRIHTDFDATFRGLELILAISGLNILIERFASFESIHRNLSASLKGLSAPFFIVIVIIIIFGMANVVVNNPSFNRIAVQGNLGIVLLPCALILPLVKLMSSFAHSDLRRGIMAEELKVGAKRKPGARLLFTTINTLVAIAIVQLVLLRRNQTLLLVAVFILLILSRAVFMKWRAPSTRSQNSNDLFRTFANTWLVVLIFSAAVGALPSYPKPTRWTVVEWGKQIVSDSQVLVGLTGNMPDSSEILGFHTKKDIRRCAELASLVPVGAKIFPINGLQEFAVCQGTPGLNRGQLIHHYDSILAPRFDEIMKSNVQQTLTIFRELNIGFLAMLESDCKKFLVSQKEAFDANSLSQFGVYGKGSDFVVFDISLSSRVTQTEYSPTEYLVEYSRSCNHQATQ